MIMKPSGLYFKQKFRQIAVHSSGETRLSVLTPITAAAGALYDILVVCVRKAV